MPCYCFLSIIKMVCFCDLKTDLTFKSSSSFLLLNLFYSQIQPNSCWKVYGVTYFICILFLYKILECFCIPPYTLII